VKEEDKQKQARMELVRKQARHDPVCAEYLNSCALNSCAGGGRAWIETQLDMEEGFDDEECRPF
jgi:hypothetical protein